ncbi:MAG: hypothetical protein IT450_18040 [Phycisphaerales bacterium]|nr:hypothetical protein [Phycisphaerales bacterium]
MRTSDETIRELEKLADEAATEGASPMLLALGTQVGLDIAADLRDLAAMEQRDRDGPCYYCGEMTEKHAGNPSRWPVYLCHADEPGVAKPHHAGCVSERLAQRDRMADRMYTLGEERDAAVKLAAENEAAFDGKAEEFDQLAERLAERTAERDEARAAFEKYGQHIANGRENEVCDLTVIDAFEPGPPRRFKVRGKWRDTTPVCTCGLDAAIGGAPNEPARPG